MHSQERPLFAFFVYLANMLLHECHYFFIHQRAAASEIHELLESNHRLKKLDTNPINKKTGHKHLIFQFLEGG
jgi:hypothetical protein